MRLRADATTSTTSDLSRAVAQLRRELQQSKESGGKTAGGGKEKATRSPSKDKSGIKCYNCGETG